MAARRSPLVRHGSSPIPAWWPGRRVRRALGTSSPGVLTFAGAPSSGTAIAADFSYYWPVRMSDDSVLFNMFLSQYYCKKVQLHQHEELTRPPLAPAIRKGNI